MPPAARRFHVQVRAAVVLGDLAEVGEEHARPRALGGVRVGAVAQILERLGQPMRRQWPHLRLARNWRRLRQRHNFHAVVAEQREHRHARQLQPARRDGLGAGLRDARDVVLQRARDERGDDAAL